MVYLKEKFTEILGITHTQKYDNRLRYKLKFISNETLQT